MLTAEGAKVGIAGKDTPASWKRHPVCSQMEFDGPSQALSSVVESNYGPKSDKKAQPILSLENIKVYVDFNRKQKQIV